MSVRRALVVGGLALAVGALGAGYFRYRVHAARSHYVPPVLVDPPPGPRAPSAELLGAHVGTSRLAEVRATAGAWGVLCADRSVRKLMGELRDKKRAELEDAKRRGTPDTVTGASILTHRTARDDNPQVRLSCEDVSASHLADRARVPSTGRLLYVFDDERAPLRHVSYQRNHAVWDTALADFTTTRDAFTERFGNPHESESGTGAKAPPSEPLQKYARRIAEFRFSDLVGTVTLANLGGRGYSVGETLEVPMPIRADAPAH